MAGKPPQVGLLKLARDLGREPASSPSCDTLPGEACWWAFYIYTSERRLCCSFEEVRILALQPAGVDLWQIRRQRFQSEPAILAHALAEQLLRVTPGGQRGQARQNQGGPSERVVSHLAPTGKVRRPTASRRAPSLPATKGRSTSPFVVPLAGPARSDQGPLVRERTASLRSLLLAGSSAPTSARPPSHPANS